MDQKQSPIAGQAPAICGLRRSAKQPFSHVSCLDVLRHRLETEGMDKIYF